MRRAQSLVPKCVSSRGLESESAEWGEREKTHSLPAAARHQLRPPDARSPGSPPLSPCSSFLPPPPPPLVHSFPYMLPLPSFLPIPLFSLLLLSFPPVSPIPPSVPINSPLKKKLPPFSESRLKAQPKQRQPSPVRTHARKVDFPSQNTQGCQPCRKGVSCRIFTLPSGLGFRGGAAALAAKVARRQEVLGRGREGYGRQEMQEEVQDTKRRRYRRQEMLEGQREV